MLALRSEPTFFSIVEAQRVARSVYGLAGSLSALSGERDCNFRVRTEDSREYVLKIADSSADAQATDCQVRVLRHLSASDPSLPVPRLQATLQGGDVGSVVRAGVEHAVCLVEYLPGQLLSESRPDAKLLRNLGHTLARVDRALRGFFHPALGHCIAWDVRRLPELMAFASLIESDSIRAAVESVSATVIERSSLWSGLRSQAIHGDCHAANLLIDNTDNTICGILDFGDMIHAPVVLEVAVGMAELLTDGLAHPSMLNLVLEGYAAGECLESGDVAALYDLITSRLAVTILLHAWRSRHNERGALLLGTAAAKAGLSLLELMSIGRDHLTAAWQEAAGIFDPGPRAAVPRAAVPPAPVSPSVSCAALQPSAAFDLNRRRRALGAGAELFYEQPLHIVRGTGVWLYDAHDGAYLDVYNNVPHVGHAHPTVVRAIQRQTALLTTHTRYVHEAIVNYAEELTARCPPQLNACIFVNSGSEANDVAWRMAQFATGNQGAVVLAHAYHGITDAVAALTPGAGRPSDPKVVTLAPPADLSFGCPVTQAALKSVSEDIERGLATLASRGFAPAALLIDTALTSSGIYDPPPAWLAQVALGIRNAGGLVVADEVQYGLGRSGSCFWGFERRGLSPDIVTLGKPIGNGYPMGVVIANRSLIESFQAKFGFFSTFGGNPVAAAAGLAVLHVLDGEGLQDNAEVVGSYLRQALVGLAARHKCFAEVRGAGLLLGLEVIGSDIEHAKRRARTLINHLVSNDRVLIGSEGPHANILKLRPPMPFRREHADLVVRALDSAAARMNTDGV